MLHFRGSDCRRSLGSTWYGGMDSLPMALGFTKSKADSNLYFKVEGGRTMFLLLYVDELFLKEKRNSLKFPEDTCCRVQDEGLGYDALLSRHGGVAGCEWNILGTREVCGRDPEEVQDDGMQVHDHTYGINLNLLSDAS